MYNLRKNKTNNKRTKISKPKNNTSLSLNMETTASKNSNALLNTPVNKFIKERQSYGTDSPFKLLTIMETRFDKLSHRIEKVIEEKLSQYKHELLNELDRKFNKIQNDLRDITERVSLLESVAVDTKSMQEEIVLLKTKIRQQENDTVARELRINEIPYSEHENLTNIFCTICDLIKTTVPAIESVYRTQNHTNNTNGTSSRDSAIIVKMRSRFDRNSFFKALANHRKLNKDFSLRLRLIGINSDNKFYVNENLTKTNFNIFREAVRLKRRNIIHSAFTMRGFVFIRKKPHDDIIQIDDIKQLQLFSENIALVNKS